MRVTAIAMIILWLFTLAVDWGVGRTLGSIVNPKRRKRARLSYLVSSIVCWIWLIVILCLPRRNASVDLLPVIWMLFAYLSIYFAKLFYLIFYGLLKVGSKIKGVSLPLRYAISISAGITVLLILWIGALSGRRQIETNRINITSSKLPSSFDGFKIVQFSDAHVGTWGNDTTFISSLVDSINSLKPDLIVFTGDIVSRNSYELDPFVRTFSRLYAPFGVYAVHGNHDYGLYTAWDNKEAKEHDVTRLDSMINKMGWKLLKNDKAFLSIGADSIALLGVENWGEPPFNQLGNLSKIYSPTEGHDLNDSMFKILLTHNPEHWRQVVVKESNIDVSLSGHTHAMQTMLRVGNKRWSPAKWKYKQWGGLYEDSTNRVDKRLYVNIGCGEVGLPARIGMAFPELTLITLSGNSNTNYHHEK